MSSPEEQAAFEQANQVVHPVEKQWHYPIMVEFGFKPIIPDQTGFVRTYVYENAHGRQITCTTGCNSDYWKDSVGNAGGYWSSLKPYLQSLLNPQS